MKKFWLPILVFLLGCQLLPTPNDFPPTPPTEPGTAFPMTVIVELPMVTPTTTIEPNLRPILSSDLEDARTFFLIIKTSMMAGDDIKIAESVKYPIRVILNGQEVVFHDQEEFLARYEEIFDQDFMNVLFELDESDLILLPNGVQVGNGELWLNYYCTDLSCSDSQFLITQINK